MTDAIWAAQLIKDIFVQSSPYSITEVHKAHRLKVSDVNYHADKHFKIISWNINEYEIKINIVSPTGILLFFFNLHIWREKQTCI